LKKEAAFISNGRVTTWGGAPNVTIIAVLAINHACYLSLGRDDGVTIVGNTDKLRIHTIRIDESPRDFHEQLEGLAGGLNPVIVFKVHTDTQEINTNTHLAIPEVPRVRHEGRELDRKVVQNEFWLRLQRSRHQAAGDGSSWVWLAGGGFLCAAHLLCRRGSLVLLFGVFFYVIVVVVIFAVIVVVFVVAVVVIVIVIVVIVVVVIIVAFTQL
jgi:hypothetical protein